MGKRTLSGGTSKRFNLTKGANAFSLALSESELALTPVIRPVMMMEGAGILLGADRGRLFMHVASIPPGAFAKGIEALSVENFSSGRGVHHQLFASPAEKELYAIVKIATGGPSAERFWQGVKIHRGDATCLGTGRTRHGDDEVSFESLYMLRDGDVLHVHTVIGLVCELGFANGTLSLRKMRDLAAQKNQSRSLGRTRTRSRNRHKKPQADNGARQQRLQRRQANLSQHHARS